MKYEIYPEDGGNFRWRLWFDEDDNIANSGVEEIRLVQSSSKAPIVVVVDEKGEEKSRESSQKH